MSLCLFVAPISQPTQLGVDSQLGVCELFWPKMWKKCNQSVIFMHKPTFLHLTSFSSQNFLNHAGYTSMCLVFCQKVEKQVFVNSRVIIIWAHICYRTKMFW